MLSKRVLNLKGSPTLALASQAKELKAQGKDVISLSVGEPDWDTFESIKKAGYQAIERGVTKYTPAAGTPELRKAIAHQTSEDLGLSYDFSQVTVSSGGKFIIFCALQSLLDPGDEVIIPAPYWVSYPDMVELAGGSPKIVQTSAESQFKITSQALENAIGEKTKIFILNSPSNPTGEMYSDRELSEIAKVLKKYPHIVVLSDDIYNRLVFNQEGLAPHVLKIAPELRDRTLIVNGVSKTYSMTGWRLGWAVGPNELIGGMSRFQSQSTSCASSITQAAAVQAITGGQPELKQAIKVLQERRDFVFQALSSIDGIQMAEPQGAFYAWPHISHYFGRSFKGIKIENSQGFAENLLADQTVVAVPGIYFGLDGYLRISYVLNQNRMQEAVDRLRAFINKLQ